ncbi:MAG TPA: hypothetical protein VHM00_08710 [Caldimonas sp.]|jgi:hypothetical protein|nr:hypothetical protein [Caldimonas sp.]HEX2541149.1 hypothetical protein [Caldimonas sp.]
MDSLLNGISSVWAAASTFLNSNLVIAFVGGLTGAVGGALGAQRIVESSKKREERLRELRYTNAAIMVSFSICNAALAIKKQFVQPMWDAFQRSKRDLQDFQTQRQAGQVAPATEFHLQMDMNTFPAPVVPLESLKHIAFQELSIVGRPLALVAVIEQSLKGLAVAVEKRDLTIQRFASGEIPEKLQANFYFGLPLPGGHRHEEYPDLVEGIHSYVDDVAFFSALLCSDLMKHGALVRVALTRRFGGQAPKVSSVDFSGPRQSGLVPPDSQYEDWLKAFVERGDTDAQTFHRADVPKAA